MMIIFQGKVLSAKDDKAAAGYTVQFSLKGTISTLEKRKASETIVVPISISTTTGADGSFHAVMDSKAQPKGPVDLVVSAPNGVVVERQQIELGEAQQPLKLLVNLVPLLVVTPSGDPTRGQRLRVSGHVIDERGRPVPAGLPVVIWGVGQPDDGSQPTERPLIVAETQPNGLFSGDWPAMSLARAFGKVAGGPPTPVTLDDNGRLVRKILLVIDLDRVDPALRQDAKCDCAVAPPRVPEPQDLTANPGAFSQDLAGGCVDLTMPNRVLEEFYYFLVVRTSEPPIKGVTLGLKRRVPKDLLVDLLGVSVASAALGRRTSTTIRLPTSDLGLDVRAAKDLVRHDRPPTLAEIERAAWLSEVAHTKEQINASQRQSSGRVDLDASHAIDWDDTPTIYLATGLAHGHILRYREVWRADGYSLGDLLYSLPLAPMQRRQIAVVDWDRSAVSAREEQLEFEEELDALLSRDRDVQEIVGSNLHEESIGNSSNTTWGVSGGIGAGFIGSGFGIFGGVSGGFSGSDSDAHQTASRRFSADSLQRLRDRVTQRSSSVRSARSIVVQTVAQGETLRAETEVVANYNHCHAITVEYFEVLRHFLVTHELADVQECLFVPLPVVEFTRVRALRWREPLARYLKDRNLREGFNAIERIADNWVGWDFPEERYSEEAPQSLEGELRISFLLPRPRDDEDGKFLVELWQPYTPWLPQSPRELHTARLIIPAAAERDRVFRQEIAPVIAKNLVQGLRFAYVGIGGGETLVGLDATLVSRYEESRPLYITLNPAGALPNVPREEIAHFKIWFEGVDLPPDAQVIVHSGRMRYDTGHMRTLLFDNNRILDDLRAGDPVVVPTPVTRAELRNPREEDRELANRLVDHLNKHLEYYSQAIWLSLDAQRRYMLLDAILLPGLDGRSVASVCVNEVIGVAGNSLVLPVAPGQRLEPLLQTVDDEGNLTPLENAYTTPPAPPLRVSVPTRGVYAEVVSGECKACEEIDDSRYWRWTMTGQPALPGIETVSTSTRASDEPTLTPTELPKPLVSIQSAPQVPDPFGLSAAFQLLSKPDLFRDITGLEGSQKNARAAFDAAISAASAVGDEAVKLAVQNELARNSERMLNRINQAQKDELLTPEVAQELANATLKGFLGEGKTGNAKSGDGETGNNKPTGKKAEEKLLDQAVQSRTAEIKQSNADETVEISFDDDAPVLLGSTVAVPGSLDIGPKHPLFYIDQPVILELGADPRLPPGDLTPFVMDTYDLLQAASRDVDAIVAAGHVLKKQSDPARYQLERRLRIVYPTDPASTKNSLPVAVIVHGNHFGWQVTPPRPSHEGYTYLQNALASHGILSISVDMNAANWFDNALVEMRAQMTLGALDALSELNKDASLPFHNRINFNKVALIGHSRGGEAVVRAAQINQSQTRPVHYGIQVVCSLAPTDFSGTTPTNAFWPRLDPDATAIPFYAVIYGALDGDVSGEGGAKSFGGTGFRLYDRAKTQKAMVFLDGCGHNRFNSVWATDGDEPLIPPPDKGGRLLSTNNHQELAKEYIGGLLRWRLLGQDSERGLFDGTKTNHLGAGVSSQYSFGSAIQVLDDFETTQPSRVIQDAVIKPFADITIGTRSLEQETNHQTTVLSVTPNLPNTGVHAFQLNLAAGQRNWSGFDALLLRVCADFDHTDDGTIKAGRLPEFEIVVTGTNDQSVITSSSALNAAGVLHRPVRHELLQFSSSKSIDSSSPGSPATIKTKNPHGLITGQKVGIRDHGGTIPNIPNINDIHSVIVISPTEFTIPVTLTTGGTGGAVVPLMTIISSTLGSPTTITTLTPHNLISNKRIYIDGHSSTPNLFGSHTVTVTSPTTFTIPVTMISAGIGGFLVPLKICTVLRLETLTMPLTLLSQQIRADVKSLFISPSAGFPRHMFFDSLELVRFS